ncbi:hypothetical protein FRB94_006622 [Tulasnella sp. JGI-2019a]|nr:hypothetical protein FRB93_001917 [Tulasnella sp. JGI-2019a]KAG8998821.1 hypothetical protein FRB94_006622 [Tulasnella sp. JGI-2019a]
MIGLPADDPSIVEFSPMFTPDVIRKGLEQTNAAISGAGYDYHEFLFPQEDNLNRLINQLKERTWDGIIIGFGVRGNPKMTEYFEAIVNTIREYAPQAKFIFNHSPPSSLDGVKRQVPLV